MPLLYVPYLLVSLGIPLMLTVPFYFFNQYLIRKTKPRESGKNLLIYFLLMAISSCLYIAGIMFLIIKVAMLLK